MRTDFYAWLAIALMGVVAFFTRAGGLWLARWMPDSPFWHRFLDHLPGTLLLAIVVPYFLSGEPAAFAGACVALGLAIARVNLVLVMAVSMAVVALLRWTATI